MSQLSYYLCLNRRRGFGIGCPLSGSGFFFVKCSLAREHNRDTILMQITICGSASRFRSIFHVQGRLQMSFFWPNRPKKTRTSQRNWLFVFLQDASLKSIFRDRHRDRDRDRDRDCDCYCSIYVLNVLAFTSKSL